MGFASTYALFTLFLCPCKYGVECACIFTCHSVASYRHMKFYTAMTLPYCFDSEYGASCSLRSFMHANKCLSSIPKYCILLAIFSHILQAELWVTNRCNFHRLKLNSAKLQPTMKAWFPFLNLQRLWLFKVMHIYKSESPKVMRTPCVSLHLSCYCHFYNKCQSAHKAAAAQPPMLYLLTCISIQKTQSNGKWIYNIVIQRTGRVRDVTHTGTTNKISW